MILLGWLFFAASWGALSWWCGGEFGRSEQLADRWADLKEWEAEMQESEQ